MNEFKYLACSQGDTGYTGKPGKMGAPGIEVSHLPFLDSPSNINREKKKRDNNLINPSKDENSSEFGVVFIVFFSKEQADLWQILVIC